MNAKPPAKHGVAAARPAARSRGPLVQLHLLVQDDETSAVAVCAIRGGPDDGASVYLRVARADLGAFLNLFVGGWSGASMCWSRILQWQPPAWCPLAELASVPTEPWTGVWLHRGAA